MKDNRRIDIKARPNSEHSTYVEIDGKKHLVVTDSSGSMKPVITTNIYLDGEIVTTRKSEFAIEEGADVEAVIQGFIERQHESTVNLFKAEKDGEKKTPEEFLRDVRNLLRRKSPKSAQSLLGEAIERHPEDPMLLSYHGCLTAVVNKNFEFGINRCKQALKAAKEGTKPGEKGLSPVIYLNLGRAYLAAGKKELALDAFKRGLKADPRDRDIGWEMSRLGKRKKPPISFLKRSNPLNKYIGVLLHKIKR